MRDIPKTNAKTAKESHDQIWYCCESPGKDVFILAKTLFLSHTRLFNMLHGLIDRRQFINNPPGGGRAIHTEDSHTKQIGISSKIFNLTPKKISNLGVT